MLITLTAKKQKGRSPSDFNLCVWVGGVNLHGFVFDYIFFELIRGSSIPGLNKQ